MLKYDFIHGNWPTLIQSIDIFRGQFQYIPCSHFQQSCHSFLVVALYLFRCKWSKASTDYSTRTKLEQLTLHIVEKIRDPLMKVLADTHLEPKGMDKIILIGGMTRMPLVRKFVEDIIGKPV